MSESEMVKPVGSGYGYGSDSEARHSTKARMCYVALTNPDANPNHTPQQ